MNDTYRLKPPPNSSIEQDVTKAASLLKNGTWGDHMRQRQGDL